MILLYHKISREKKTIWYVTDNAFRKQMQYLRKSGKVVVPLKNYDPSNPRHVAITFDGGYDEMYETAVPILKEFAFEYDIFLIGDYVGKDNSFDTGEPLEKFLSVEHLKEIVATGGAHLQWHTNSHKKVDSISNKADWIAELTIPNWIRDIDRLGFTYFAFPFGGNVDWQFEEVKKRFDGALLVGGGVQNDRYRLSRVVIFEDTDFILLTGSAVARCLRRVELCIKERRVLKTSLKKMMRGRVRLFGLLG